LSTDVTLISNHTGNGPRHLLHPLFEQPTIVHAVSGPERRNIRTRTLFPCQESAMFENPILVVVTALVIVAVLWSVFR
ncbi:MAG: hypothetical protein WA728_25830, partial [Xanthobacteraceae bacterium]